MPKSSTVTQTGCLTLRHALEDMQKAHEQVFDLLSVQFVTAQHSAAQSRRTLVLERQKTNESFSYRAQTAELQKIQLQRDEEHQSNKLQRLEMSSTQEQKSTFAAAALCFEITASRNTFTVSLRHLRK